MCTGFFMDGKNSSVTMPHKMVFRYLVISGIWVCFSNAVLPYCIADPVKFARIALYNGLAFAAVTAALLYVLQKHSAFMAGECEQRHKGEHTRNNEFMTAIFDGLTDGIVACDKDGRLALFNRSARKFHGQPEKPLPPEQWAQQYDIYEKDGITPMRMENIPLFKALQGHTVTNQEMIIAPKGSKPLTLLATGRPLVSGTGEIVGAVASMHDVTAVKALEEHARQSQKLDSIGALAGGVAHDFNNILTVIIGACALLKKSTANDPEQPMLITAINNSAERAAKLTQSLLAFSHRQSISRQPEDLVGIVKVMQEFLARIIGKDILLAMYLPDEPLPVMADRGKIEQVLLSLATNARDAMPNGGVLSISVSQIESAGSLLEMEGYRPGSYALITVSDTGTGIDEATRKRIFEPFFTTRGVGSGAGLGLSIAYGIIRQQDGAIYVHSEPGEGTTFKIYLPLCDKHGITPEQRDPWESKSPKLHDQATTGAGIAADAGVGDTRDLF